MAKRASNKPEKTPAREPAVAQESTRWARPFIYTALAVGGFMLLRSMLMETGKTTQVNALAASGWGQFASLIIDRKIAALIHGGLIMLLAGAGLHALLLSARRSSKSLATIGALLVALAAVDAFLLSRHYIKAASLAGMQENEVIRLLASDGESRVALVSQDGFYNHWLTYLFPYHGIRSVNVTQMPRMPEDYKAFLGSVGRNMIRMWELSAVEFILGPSALWNQLQADPSLRGRFELAMTYDVGEAAPGVFRVYPATAQRPGQHVVVRTVSPSPRFALLQGWESLPDTETLERLADPAFRPFERVLIAEEHAALLEPLDGTGVTGSHTLNDYRSGMMALTVVTDRPAILRIAEKYDPDWRATLNGNEVPVVRADFLFQGVAIPPGTHELVLRFAPPTGTLWLQAASLSLCLVAGLWVFLGRVRRRPVHA